MDHEDLDQIHDPSEYCRDPQVEDVVRLCRALNESGANYIVVGGFAMITAGYARFTTDIDLLVDASSENELKVFAAMMTLPDKAVSEVQPGEIAAYTVVRVGDEFTVDLMASCSGLTFEKAAPEIVSREIQGVPIPFASPRLLWRMKSKTHREKDIPDLIFLREWFAARGEQPPE